MSPERVFDSSRRLERAAWAGAAAAAVGAAFGFVGFYSAPGKWATAHVARYALPLIAVPTFGVFLASFWLQALQRTRATVLPLRLAAWALCALVVSVVSFQSFTWSKTAQRVLAKLEPGCTDSKKAHRLPRSARLVDHWSISPLSLVQGENAPDAPLLLYKGTCAEVACRGRYWVAPRTFVDVKGTPFAALAAVSENPTLQSSCARGSTDPPPAANAEDADEPQP